MSGKGVGMSVASEVEGLLTVFDGHQNGYGDGLSWCWFLDYCMKYAKALH